MILKTQINMRLAPDLNISQSFEHIIESEADAETVGESDARTLDAYMRGYARGADEAAQS